jgi:hypothetical protein
MARPIKNNADYFSHDSGMRNDEKIKAIRKKFKSTGYAVYNMLLEYMTSKEHFTFKLDDLTIELISGDFDEDPELIKTIIDYCLKIDLLQVIDGYIKCKTLEKRFELLLSKRKRTRKGVMDSDNTQSKVKESKVKKSIKYNTHGSGKVFVSVRAQYAGEKPDRIYQLEKYFESRGQLQNLTEGGMIRFSEFVTSNVGQVYNDYNHVYSAFRKFCIEGAPVKIVPPACKEDPYAEAVYNLGMFTLDAWRETYKHKIKTDPGFRERFKEQLK